MDIEEHVSKPRTPLKGLGPLRIPLRASAGRGYVLASVVALMFFLAVLLGAAVSQLGYSSGVTEAWLNRVQARNALESMTNLSLRRLASEVKKGANHGTQAVVEYKELTETDSLRIFALNYYDGCKVTVYNLDCAGLKESAGAPYMLPSGFPGGYMIRAEAEKDGMARLTLESVYAVTFNAVPGGGTIEVLDEHPVYSREIFRN